MRRLTFFLYSLSFSNVYCRRKAIWYYSFVWFRAMTHQELNSLKSFLFMRLLLFIYLVKSLNLRYIWKRKALGWTQGIFLFHLYLYLCFRTKKVVLILVFTYATIFHNSQCCGRMLKQLMLKKQKAQNILTH